jgi:hypothetical protein
MWGGDASDTAPGGRAGSVPGNCLDKSSVARAVSSAATDTPRDSTPVRRPEGISNHNRPRCWRTNSHTSRLRWSGPDTDSWRQRPYRQTLLAEIGPSLSRFADAPTFTSWRTTGNGLVSMPELRWAMGEIWAQLGRKIPLFPAQIRSSRSVRPTDST